jgi:hypothetical protein
MTLDATGSVSFWESSPPSPSISDVRSLTELAEAWRASLPRARALGVVVMATGHRPRLIPFAGSTESASRAWEFGKYSLGWSGTALTLPEGPAGASML